jgi:hypothetical protein
LEEVAAREVNRIIVHEGIALESGGENKPDGANEWGPKAASTQRRKEVETQGA